MRKNIRSELFPASKRLGRNAGRLLVQLTALKGKTLLAISEPKEQRRLLRMATWSMARTSTCAVKGSRVPPSGEVKLKHKPLQLNVLLTRCWSLGYFFTGLSGTEAAQLYERRTKAARQPMAANVQLFQSWMPRLTMQVAKRSITLHTAASSSRSSFHLRSCVLVLGM